MNSKPAYAIGILLALGGCAEHAPQLLHHHPHKHHSDSVATTASKPHENILLSQYQHTLPPSDRSSPISSAVPATGPEEPAPSEPLAGIAVTAPALDTVPEADPQPKPPALELAHDPQYSWLEGQLEYRYRTGRWRVRYAPPWEEDRFGGCLALQGINSTYEWNEGDWVRVEGRLRSSQDDSEEPYYKVEHISLLTP